MRSTLLASLLFAIPLVAAAQQSGLMLNDLKAQNAIQLTVDELRQLLPGANMSRRTNAGSTHRWTNEPGGQMIVSSDGTGRFQGGGRGVPDKAHGISATTAPIASPLNGTDPRTTGADIFSVLGISTTASAR